MTELKGFAQKSAFMGAEYFAQVVAIYRHQRVVVVTDRTRFMVQNKEGKNWVNGPDFAEKTALVEYLNERYPHMIHNQSLEARDFWRVLRVAEQKPQNQVNFY